MTPFDEFRRAANSIPINAALVLGSGLGEVADSFRSIHTIPYSDIPGLVPPSVAGHSGRLDLAECESGRILVARGRVHLYEGHSLDRVTALVKHFDGFGIGRLILTNAAGGVNRSFLPGEPMVLTHHWKLLTPPAWSNFEPVRCYSTPWIDRLRTLPHPPHFGGYAAFTGPSYETPAEIRAMAALGVDAVGMSTALEAEAGAALGMEVAAISCITNLAAGIGGETLNHKDVESTAKRGVGRMRELVEVLLAGGSSVSNFQ